MLKNSKPQYQLRIKKRNDELELAIWQMPCPASPHIARPRRMAGLGGRNLALAEGVVLKILNRAGIKVGPAQGKTQKCDLDEDAALNLGLLCKVLAPMRNAERMRQAALNMGQMAQPEAAYWLGMAMHRKNPRRVLSALRLLLTESA